MAQTSSILITNTFISILKENGYTAKRYGSSNDTIHNIHVYRYFLNDKIYIGWIKVDCLEQTIIIYKPIEEPITLSLSQPDCIDIMLKTISQHYYYDLFRVVGFVILIISAIVGLVTCVISQWL